jgi:TolB-like protein/DNA-binding SARP family transcriptional activator/Tfp pilus assembly protein PilF
LGSDLRLKLLGQFALTSAGRNIVLPGRKSRALLAFLACNAGRRHSRDRLIGLLWGERFEDQARQSLRHALTTLRKALGEDLLQADRDQVWLNESFSSDVSEFRPLAMSGDPDDLRRAIALYEDELLSGFSIPEKAFTDWLATERAELRDLVVAALMTLMERSQAEPCALDLISLARRAVALDPYREQAHRHLLRGLAMAGHRNEALMHYRHLERLLKEDLGIQPEAETRELLDAIRSGTGSAAARPILRQYPAGSGAITDQSTKAELARLPIDAESSHEHRPSIAVLPFEDFGGEGATKRLAEGIVEDIITDLARFRNLDVIARNSTALYKGRNVDLRQVGRELNVRYVVEGAIQRQGKRIRVSAQLVDAATGGAIWSERWDRADKDIFAIQAEVSAQVAGALGGMGGSAAINAEEVRKARRRPPVSLTAYDHYLLANEGRALFTAESIARGTEHANKAIARDPGLGRAYVARAWLTYIAVHYGAEFESAMETMQADARHALALDPNDAEARVTLAFYLLGRGRFEESKTQIRTALKANPNNAQVLVFAAAVQAWNGRPEEAAELADRALRLDPWMTAENLNCIKDAYFWARRFEDVVAVVSRIPDDARGRGSRLLLTLSYALLGRRDEMTRARAELLAAHPSLSAELLLNQDWIFARLEEQRLLLDGFRAAGLPACASGADLSKIPNPKRLPDCVQQQRSE